tara:strand:- start:6 stop:341 length:336 start_codon:yes stop_codon:yes gene_type:complete
LNKFCRINKKFKHQLFLKAILKQIALTHGAIAIVNNKIPIKIFSCGFINSAGDETIFTLKIITGMLSSIIIMLPITTFLSLSKFIELDIEDSADNIGDPIIKVNSNNSILF